MKLNVSQFRLLAPIGAACLWVSGAIVLMQDNSTDASSVATDRKPAAAISTELTSPTVPTFAEARKRPLFRLDRRPFVAPVVDETIPNADAAAAIAEPSPPQDILVEELPPVDLAPETAVTTVPQIRLRGVYVTNLVELALLETASGAPPTWHGVGSTMEGWQVDKIFPEAVILKQGENTHTIKLYVDNLPSAVAN